jgi:hypothetical protein
MADNVAITAGSGTTIATDDIAGVQVQRVKATWGPDGTANDTDDAAGKAKRTTVKPLTKRSSTRLLSEKPPSFTTTTSRRGYD